MDEGSTQRMSRWVPGSPSWPQMGTGWPSRCSLSDVPLTRCLHRQLARPHGVPARAQESSRNRQEWAGISSRPCQVS